MQSSTNSTVKPLEGQHIIGFIYGTELYGSERGNLTALGSMQRNGARITVGVSSRTEGGGAVGEAARALGFNVLEVPFGGPLSGHSMRAYKSYRKRQYRKLRSVSQEILPELRALNPSHILIGSPLAHIYLAIALFRLGKPIIYRMGDAPGTGSKIQPLLWRILASRSRSIVANSRFVHSLVERQGRRFSKKSVVIHNIAPNRDTPLDESLLRELEHSKRPTQLVYVGQLTRRKGVHDLAEALIALDDPELGCWFVGGATGEPGLLEEMESRIRSSNTRTDIQFMGFQPDPRPYFRAADWHMAPSTYGEPFANVTLEAKAGATASIVSNRGGFPEAIRDEQDGFIVEPGAEPIRAAIQKAKSLDAESMGQAALDSTANTFSRARFDERWAQVILSAS